MKTHTKLLLLSVAFFSVVVPVYAGVPDGAGPWADAVISSAQALRKNGTPVLPVRSNPSSALGPAENNTVDGNFFSLGFGGNMVLKFDNPISDGVVLVEATNTGFFYPSETARIELSADGVTWLTAGNVSSDGSVPMPERLSCARYVRITDTSNPANFSNPEYAEADGYDVDGVRATDGVPCETPNVPEFGSITAMLATLTSGGAFVFLKKKLGMG